MLNFTEVLQVFVGVIFVPDHLGCFAQGNSVKNSIFLPLSLGNEVFIFIFLNCFESFVQLLLAVQRE